MPDPIAEYYDGVAENYHEQYDSKNLYDLSKPYPANYFRLRLLVNRFLSKGIRRAIDIGCGDGTPMETLASAGVDMYGFDISKEMVRVANKRRNFASPVCCADIRDPSTYVSLLMGGRFDGLIAMGVMPHIESDDMVMENMAALLKPDGTAFVEFRNKLFSLFTFNRHTHDFVLNDLLEGISSNVKERVELAIKERCLMDMPPRRDTNVPFRFHNPLDIHPLFERHGFRDMKLHYYHYHPAMPYLEYVMREEFRREAVRLEGGSSGWRGMFLCSAFIVETVKLG